MKGKSTLFFLLFLTLIFGLFSAQSDIYAQEAGTEAKTKTEVSQEKAETKATVNTSQESSKVSEGEPVEEKQIPPPRG